MKPSCSTAMVMMLAALSASMRLAAAESGPQDLQKLLAANQSVIRDLRENKTRLDDFSHAELRAQIDAKAHQRDAYASGLYWFTDLEAAKAEAARVGRPILSLRLLGKLDEEYSCANSRFFRTVLYANAEVSALLREKFVLHWQSVRPAPLLTIDMGDGRRIKRTITGNSIHYVLDETGRVLDALPGIYSPSAFLLALARVKENASERTPAQLRTWHGQEAHQLCMEWLNNAGLAGAYGDAARIALDHPQQADKTLQMLTPQAFPAGTGSPINGVRVSLDDSLRRFDMSGTKLAATEQVEHLLFGIPVIAKFLRAKAKASGVAVPFESPSEFDPPKAMVERPVMRHALPGPANAALDPASPAVPSPTLAGRMTAELWALMAEPFQRSVHLDKASRRFMLQKLPADLATPDEFKTGAPTSDQTAFGRLLQRFESSIAQDMVRNEYFYHTQIHQWLEADQDGQLVNDVEALNRRVYQELFLTPDYDAWLGLVPEDTYTAIEKDGCACDRGAPPMRKSGSQ